MFSIYEAALANLKPYHILPYLIHNLVDDKPARNTAIFMQRQ